MTTETRFDTENLYDWASIEITCSPEGVLEGRTILYDDGTLRFETYTGGILSEILLCDVTENGGNTDWDSVFMVYDATGQIAARITNYDDGIRREEEFVDGARSRTLQIDTTDPASAESAADWDTIETFYDQHGFATARITVFDSGFMREDQFQFGSRTQTVETDIAEGGGFHAWASRETFYDPFGGVLFRVSHMDDGVRREESYDFGNISRITEFDEAEGPEGQGAYDWDTRDRYFDMTGTLQAQVIGYDDGSLREDLYQEGELREIRRFDSEAPGSADWSTIFTVYEPGGSLQAKVITYDNGIVREDLYEGGQRVVSVQEDVPLDGGLFNWERIETSYDAAGTLTSKFTLYDDGTSREATYEAGELRQVLRLDNPGDPEGGLFSWKAIANEYDESGARTLQAVQYDTLDERIQLFDPTGTLQTRLDFDGDDSAPWVFRVIEYDGTGGSETSTYDSVLELPPEYQGYFADVMA